MTNSFLIADDHTITQFGTKLLLKSIFQDCEIEEAENGQIIFEKLKDRPFDMLITDLSMPETDTFRLIDTALSLQPKLRILILSMSKEYLHASNYLKKGALGYIEKNNCIEELTRAITTVFRGDIYMSPALTKAYAFGTMKNKENPFFLLTQRELDICRMLCAGNSITNIGVTLTLSVSTVGTHKMKILKKTGASNLLELLKLFEYHSLSM